IDVQADGSVEWWTRHGVRHKAWTPTTDLTDFFGNFPGSTLVGELLHSRGPSVKNTIYVFDIIKHEGESLVGTTFRHRQEQIMPAIQKVASIRGNVWFAKNYTDVNFGGTPGNPGLFESLHDPLDEGVVVKNPDGVLEP